MCVSKALAYNSILLSATNKLGASELWFLAIMYYTTNPHTFYKRFLLVALVAGLSCTAIGT